MVVSKQPRIDCGDGPELIDLIGGRIEIVGRADTSNADAVIIRGAVAPGAGVPLHSHDDYECFHVLSGKLDVFIDPHGWNTVEAGRTAVIANGERHAIRNTTADLVELAIVVNNRLARFFQEAGTAGAPNEPPQPPTPEKIDRVLAAAARYGYWMATPEEHAALTG
jgi:quercetin dioxygenase-like cupin family protein